MNTSIKSYHTSGGLLIHSVTEEVDKSYREKIITELNDVRGAYFCSSFEYPGRYTRWDIGFINPPIEIQTFGRNIEITALDQKGLILLEFIYDVLKRETYLETLIRGQYKITGRVAPCQEIFPEEQRSRQKSVFSVVRSLLEAFYSDLDAFLGLYGSFGYDLIFQFESIHLKRPRDEVQADMILFIPDEIFVIDHQKDDCFRIRYDFEFGGLSSLGQAKTMLSAAGRIKNDGRTIPAQEISNDTEGRYAEKVRIAKAYFKRGDFFEVVPSHTFYRSCEIRPSEIFENLTKINPSPYGFLIHLGNEHLIGSSPEMFVRVEGRRIETCPISGTIPRGRDALEDAERIRELLNSHKDESELTMCTDVDRNDKSRICIPGTVKVLGRRQIEMYSHLIHTVDHVEGILADGYDALDAFMTHMWAVTVTGAPKKAAVQWIEDHEESNRMWYGGAVGILGFDGRMNTGLTLRTIRLKDGIAGVRVGATLLYDSIPEEEEKETIVKAEALLKVLGDAKAGMTENRNDLLTACSPRQENAADPFQVLLVDHEDSFVHTLASYFRKAGCQVVTMRHHLAREALKKERYDLVVLSPGPGKPSDFKLRETIGLCLDKGIPLFGVCLGLQGIVEYFNGKLGVLDIPVHGKQSALKISPESVIFKKLANLRVGRYHSLFAEKVPPELEITAWTEDGVVMAVESKDKNILAVQFHPESIMSMDEDQGFRIITNILSIRGGAYGA
ncbi:anthranilate synthase component I [Dehalobacter restrictus]|uniref:Anthranilate synthase n=1 Tax=Dehalobacter restrictus (strain DSM 9455 / PER-K23) TaxID=871738 RepID=A0ABM5P5G3_DEHRP|nr:anthranilate synthase component I [Dehalobacter restrictus]AHF09856.1 anthranilate synthase subunit I [Dehalobacter restrictus DSM 9455]